MEPTRDVSSGSCPRCGVGLERTYKYCPNCSMRLRPELVEGPQTRSAPPPATLGSRLIALGGYLAFASLLLLVVLTGFELFAPPPPTPDEISIKVRPRDNDAILLKRKSFGLVEAGNALWGVYDAAAYEREEERRIRIRHFGIKFEIRDPDNAELPEGPAVFPRFVRVHQNATGADGFVFLEASGGEDLVILVNKGEFDDEGAIRYAMHPDYSVACEPYETVSENKERPPPVESFPIDDPFELGVHEVTNDQYYEFLKAWARKAGRSVPPWLFPQDAQDDPLWPKTNRADLRWLYRRGEGNYPVTSISFPAARAFCAWFWEERLGRHPDLVVDLPTAYEWLLAARGSELENLFPWGRVLFAESEVNLSGAPAAVDDAEAIGHFGGFFALVGNASEWVHGYDADSSPTAAGWSSLDGAYYDLLRDGKTKHSPFSSDGFKTPVKGTLSAVGFRIVIRRAPSMPTFTEVGPGTVILQAGPRALLPPIRESESAIFDPAELGNEDTSSEVTEAVRFPPVAFDDKRRTVTRGFGMTQTEITNRQYLAFLVDRAREGVVKPDLYPPSWDTEHPFFWGDNYQDDAVFWGHYGNPNHVERVYAPGSENRPVQAIRPDQAESYARWLSSTLGQRCRLPTVAEYLQAGRQNRRDPYPWGDDTEDQRLVCAGRADEAGRSISLLGRLGDATTGIEGLVGNLMEYVRDEDRYLLAGGCYDFPPFLCTLDTFIVAVGWQSVEYTYEGEVFGPFGTSDYAGFRLVQSQELR